MKKSLLEEIGIMLLRKGFTVKSLTRTCFDLIGRKGSQVLLIKVLEDANSISEDYAQSMKNLSSYIDASPIIVAEKAGPPLEDGVVYSRFGVYTFNYATFQNCLENSFPIIISTKAGFAASIIGSQLRDVREERGYSLGAVSRRVGVSKRMVSKYESNDAAVSLRSAVALNKLLGSSIFRKVNVFAVAKETANANPSVIARKYDALGFKAADTRKVPFDVVAKMEKELILTDVSGKGEKPSIQLESMKQLLGADALVIYDKGFDLNNRKKLPFIQKRDFLSMKSAKELIDFLKEFEPQ
jgi:putative transcriptional regulator